MSDETATKLVATGVQDGVSVVAGVRPEQMLICDKGEAGTVTGTVDVTELMGSTVHVHATTDIGQFVVLFQSVSVDFISGADLFIRKATFERLNGFDPEFFMYYEEVDLQKRMDLLGLKRIILPEVRIIHLEGESFASKRLTFRRFLIAQESFNRYIANHYGGVSKLGFRTLMGILRLTFFTHRWCWKEKCLAYLHIWK